MTERTRVQLYGAFSKARAELIDCMMGEGLRSDAIAAALSIDALQVMLIATRKPAQGPALAVCRVEKSPPAGSTSS